MTRLDVKEALAAIIFDLPHYDMDQNKRPDEWLCHEMAEACLQWLEDENILAIGPGHAETQQMLQAVEAILSADKRLVKVWVDASDLDLWVEFRGQRGLRLAAAFCVDHNGEWMCLLHSLEEAGDLVGLEEGVKSGLITGLSNETWLITDLASDELDAVTVAHSFLRSMVEAGWIKRKSCECLCHISAETLEESMVCQFCKCLLIPDDKTVY